VNQVELRYHAVQCHVRAQRTANQDDRLWLIDLSGKLAHMADVEDERLTFYACRDLADYD